MIQCILIIESTSEAITSAHTVAATSNIPFTTFETYDVENSTVENVTLEFIDLPTTEAISSTASILQYLETASYKQGTFQPLFLFLIEHKKEYFVEANKVTQTFNHNAVYHSKKNSKTHNVKDF